MSQQPNRGPQNTGPQPPQRQNIPSRNASGLGQQAPLPPRQPSKALGAARPGQDAVGPPADIPGRDIPRGSNVGGQRPVGNAGPPPVRGNVGVDSTLRREKKVVSAKSKDLSTIFEVRPLPEGTLSPAQKLSLVWTPEKAKIATEKKRPFILVGFEPTPKEGKTKKLSTLHKLSNREKYWSTNDNAKKADVTTVFIDQILLKDLKASFPNYYFDSSEGTSFPVDMERAYSLRITGPKNAVITNLTKYGIIPFDASDEDLTAFMEAAQAITKENQNQPSIQALIAYLLNVTEPPKEAAEGDLGEQDIRIFTAIQSSLKKDSAVAICDVNEYPISYTAGARKGSFLKPINNPITEKVRELIQTRRIRENYHIFLDGLGEIDATKLRLTVQTKTVANLNAESKRQPASSYVITYAWEGTTYDLGDNLFLVKDEKEVAALFWEIDAVNFASRNASSTGRQSNLGTYTVIGAKIFDEGFSTSNEGEHMDAVESFIKAQTEAAKGRLAISRSKA